MLRSLPRDSAVLAGRDAEVEAVMREAGAAAGVGVARVFAIDGTAGVGKTTFAVHLAQRLAPAFLTVDLRVIACP